MLSANPSAVRVSDDNRSEQSSHAALYGVHQYGKREIGHRIGFTQRDIPLKRPTDFIEIFGIASLWKR